MAATQQPYTTYQEAKIYLGVTDNSQDALIKMLIPKAMAFIDSYTQRTFGWGGDDPTDPTNYKSITDFPGTVNGELYDGYAGKILYLNNFDIVSIDELKLGISSLDQWQVLEPGEFVFRDDGRLILGGNYFDSGFYVAGGPSNAGNFFGAIAGGYQTISIKYHYGYAGVPGDIALACLDILMVLYTLRKTLALKQERIGDWEVVYQSNIRSQIKNQPDTLNALETYKRINVGVAQ